MTIQSVASVLQKNDKDSVLNLMNSMPSDTQSVNQLIRLSIEYRDVDTVLSFSLVRKAYNVSKDINYIEGIFQSVFNKALTYFQTGNYEKAREYFLFCYNVAISLRDAKKVGNVLLNLGNIERFLGHYANAFENYHNALKIYNLINDKFGMAKCYNNLGIVFERQSDDTSAKKYYDKALQLSIEMNFTEIAALSLVNLGNIYFMNEDYAKALQYQKQALELSNNKIDEIELSAYHNIGNIYSFLDKFQLALLNYRISLDKSKSLNNKNWISHTTFTIANLYLRQGRNDEAIIYAKESLRIAKEMKSIERIANAYLVLSIAHSNISDFEKAYEYSIEHRNAKDSVLNINSLRLISEMESMYQHAQNQKKIELLNQENINKKLIIEQEKAKKRRQLIVFVSSIVLSIIILIIVFYRIKHKQKLAKVEQEKSRFIEVIQAQEQERKRIAQDLHDSVGIMMATAKLNLTELEDAIIYKESEDEILLKNSINLIDQTHREVRNISHNMMPSTLIELGLISAIKDLIQKVNDSNQISITLNAENCRYDEIIEITVYRIIQEILNNILKHANATYIRIDILKSSEKTLLSIANDGIPLNINNIQKSTGIGWKSIYSRVSMLKGELVIHSTPHTDTIISITFPII
jgi:two-component system NarL family sensor kinase